MGNGEIRLSFKVAKQLGIFIGQFHKSGDTEPVDGGYLSQQAIQTVAEFFLLGAIQQGQIVMNFLSNSRSLKLDHRGRPISVRRAYPQAK